tara:strand:+ start:214 stop:978 length:765 start_codon:yes stop_codon:yes gene_type:complete
VFKQALKNLLTQTGIIRVKEPADRDWLTAKPPQDYSALEKYLHPTQEFFFPEFKSKAPGSKPWYAALLSSINETIENKPIKLLDYGCGNGALGNYLSGFTSDFQYYGLEPPNSPMLENAIKHGAFKFGHFNSDAELHAIEQSNCATLGSVFTHLRWNDCHNILEKLSPIAKRGGEICFTCFLDNEEKCISGNHYPYSEIETFHYSFITIKQIEQFCNQRSLKQELLPYYYDLGLRKIGLLSKTNVTHRFVRVFR